jgi:uncharacterized membrane-anchored protein YhcB (DUF1043 family)
LLQIPKKKPKKEEKTTAKEMQKQVNNFHFREREVHFANSNEVLETMFCKVIPLLC